LINGSDNVNKLFDKRSEEKKDFVGEGEKNRVAEILLLEENEPLLLKRVIEKKYVIFGTVKPLEYAQSIQSHGKLNMEKAFLGPPLAAFPMVCTEVLPPRTFDEQE
jgi:hypothetical protein